MALFPEFNPLLSLKALAYHGEPALAAMPSEIRYFLISELKGSVRDIDEKTGSGHCNFAHASERTVSRSMTCDSSHACRYSP